MIATEPRVFDPNVIQHRTVTLQNLEVRSGENAEAPMIRGYAAVFNEWAEIVPGRFRERIAPGAFKRTINNADVRALVNHDPNYVLGRNKAGTLNLREDKHGLAVEIEPPDAQWARDLMVSMKRGDISQMSFGFRPVNWTENDNASGKMLDVTLEEVRLFDVSVVTFPAYPQTEAWARSVISYLQSDSASSHSTEALPGSITPTDDPASSHSTADSDSWQSEITELHTWLESEP